LWGYYHPFIKKSIYFRDYSNEHLRQNPNQKVKTIIVELVEIPPQAKKARTILGCFYHSLIGSPAQYTSD